ncbi:MAG: GTP 3',8-cyclase MoaA [Clostridiales Family XIII bacterium]|jgi:cyclic pyranopterin phosphate synthase|nr:GTP 3',8-cyclase MoaA [Clostridiales Family XIII bacterium]
MIDHYGRIIDYLRISVTDLCNLRCIYCMPEEGVKKLRHGDILSVEEIEEIAAAAAALGIVKIRLTGGEPLIRGGILDIVRRVAHTPGIREVAMTTNATLLPRFARKLKDAGLTRVNISVDTMDPERYREITRGGEIEDVMRGIRAAVDVGLTPIKLNAVLMGGINEENIRPLIKMTEDADFRVRFIEVMPIGECSDWNKERFVSIEKVLDEEPALRYSGTDGVSKLYRKDGSKGSVGLISPISNHFCPACNKVRVTSDGMLKPCLHSAEEIPLRGLHGEVLIAAIRNGILNKPLKHELSRDGSESRRGMNAIGG